MVFKRKTRADGKRRRFSPLLWLASLAAILALVLGITGTLSQLTASILNNANNATTGGPNTLQFSETNNDTPNQVCGPASAGTPVTCSTINKFGVGGALLSPVMGAGFQHTTSVRLANTATAPVGLTGALSLTVGPCSQTPTANGSTVGDLCAAMEIHVVCSAPTDPTGQTEFTFGATTGSPTGVMTLTDFQGAMAPTTYTIGTLAPGGTVDCTFTITAPTSLPTNLEGIRVMQNLTWVFTSTTV